MLLCPWDFPGKSTGVGCHFLLQRIFPTQGSNPGLPHYKQDAVPSEPPGIPISWRIFQFVVIHTVKGVSLVNEAEVYVFLELSCFFYHLMDVGNLISSSSAFSKSSLHIWNFIVHIPLKPGLENFEHYFTSVWDECNCVVVWAFFGIAFLWDWNENRPFPVLWLLLSFPNLLAYWVQHFHITVFSDLK